MYNIHDEGGVATYAQMEAKCRGAGVDLQELASDIGADPFKLPFLWIYGRKDSTVSVMGSNIYPSDLDQCLYDEPELAALTHSFCLQLVWQHHLDWMLNLRYLKQTAFPVEMRCQIHNR